MSKSNFAGGRISVAMWTNDLDIQGISSVIMNYCRSIDMQTFTVTILAGAPIDDQYRSECSALGIRIIELPQRKIDTVKYYFALYSALMKERFNIIHIHCNSATVTPELLIAKLCGIKVRIVHSHNTTCDNLRIHRYFYPLFRKLCSARFACGEAAGRWLFNDEEFIVIPNGFQTEKFAFSQSSRERIRTALNLEGKLVLGHIGKFNNQKNQPFLLEIFEKYSEINKDAALLLIGTGPNFDEVQKLVKKHPYRDRIILYGETTDVAAMYSAMDLFVLPSRFEGLPVVLLEAQISGLPCIVSDIVSQEVDFGEIMWESINDEPEIWAKMIENVQIRTEQRSKYLATHHDCISEYEISGAVKKLEREYLTLYRQKV